jgi:glucokinase
MILAGDVGGTHTRIAYFDGGKRILEKKYRSREFANIEEIVQKFLESGKKEITRACIGVAGAVRNGKCKATNLPWNLDAVSIGQVLGAPVTLLNDLEANAYSLRIIEKEEMYLLQEGDPNAKGNQALIAAGTGLGEAGLFWDGERHHPFACEGGHADFAARNELEFALFNYLKKKFDHVSYERVVSGPGLYAIYQFLTETGCFPLSSEVQAEMERKDPSFVVSHWGAEGKDQACKVALDIFVSIYGSEAGNIALKFFAMGGLYIGGGIAPHILKQLKEGSFLASFLNKGRFRPLLEAIPIRVIMDDDSVLLGAAAYAGEL